MTTILGWKKGRGVQPISTKKKKAEQIETTPRTSKDQRASAATVICTVEGCGKKLLKAVPMGYNHFRAKHPELNTSKKAFQQWVKPLEDVE